MLETALQIVEQKNYTIDHLQTSQAIHSWLHNLVKLVLKSSITEQKVKLEI